MAQGQGIQGHGASEHDAAGAEAEGGTSPAAIALVSAVRAFADAEHAGGAPLRILCIGYDPEVPYGELAEIGAVSIAAANDHSAEAARTACPQAHVCVADPCALPFGEEFDVAVSHNVFHLVPDQIALLKSVAGALDANGMLVASMGAEGSIACIEEGFTQAMRNHSGDYSSQFIFPKEAAYRRLLGIAGLQVDQMETVEAPEALPGGPEGLRLFAEQAFAKSLGLYRPQDREPILIDFEQACRNDLWNSAEGCWMADRKHLRFTARKTRRTTMPAANSPLGILGS